MDKPDNHLKGLGSPEEEVVDMKVEPGEGVDILGLLVVGVVVDLGNRLAAVVGIVIMLQRTRLSSAFILKSGRKGHTLI